jgi:hypothetical protein
MSLDEAKKIFKDYVENEKHTIKLSDEEVDFLRVLLGCNSLAKQILEKLDKS